MPKLSQHVNSFVESPIAAMKMLAVKHGAINLSQGFPNWDPPQTVLESLSRVALTGPHQYPLAGGAKNFCEAVADLESPRLNHTIDPDKEVVVVAGGTEAMIASTLAILDPGDKVMVFSPFYENYCSDVVLSGGTPIQIPLVPPAFTFDINDVEAGFKAGAKAIIICTPNNPCGKVFTRAELEAIAKLAIQYDAFVITDEAYGRIVFEPNQQVCMASLPGMFERTITCISLSKTYSMTGWRLGYVIAPQEVCTAIRKTHGFLTLTGAAPLQEAAVSALRLPQSFYDDLVVSYAERRDHLLAGLREAGIPYIEPQGGFFLLIDIREFMRHPKFAGKTDFDFARWMVTDVGVSGVPGSSFFADKNNDYIRLHFARDLATLDEAGKRLGKIRELLK